MKGKVVETIIKSKKAFGTDCDIKLTHLVYLCLSLLHVHFLALFLLAMLVADHQASRLCQQQCNNSNQYMLYVRQCL